MGGTGSLDRDAKRFVLPLTGGLLTAAAFPDTGFYWLAWMALVPVLASVENAEPRSAFFRGWLFGFSGFLFNLAWVRRTMIDYGGIPLWLSLVFLGLLAFYCGFYPAVALWFALQIRRAMGWSWLAVLPIVWVAAEYIRAHLLTGFPWNSLGQSQYLCMPLLQNADWGSFYGISLILVAGNAALYRLITPGPAGSRWVEASVTAALILAAFGYGYLRMGRDVVRSVRVAIIQGNVDQHMKWNGNNREQVLDRHMSLTETILSTNPDLIIWPEAALTFYYRHAWQYPSEAGSSLGERMDSLIRKAGVPFVVGTLDKIDRRIFNSACMIHPGGLTEYYHKTHLVPFGEYVPLPKLLFFVNRLVESGIGTFDTGDSLKPLEFEKGSLGITICYENIFPHLVRHIVQQGADIICNLTNDAWFGRTSAAEQHFSASVFRAVENRRPVIRAANTGISGAVDTHGNILARSPLFEPAALSVDICPGTVQTVYTRWGDFVAGFCLLFSGILGIILSLRRIRA
ncbi:apolipoprotein N-acyltransferase [bacterium]|nr:apolipoprotein N-acyltransferase [candidate division CSSED10-310 bacterium]